MATISINSLPSAGSIQDTDKFIISGVERTGAQVLAFVEGDTSIIKTTDLIIKVNKNTGRGVPVTMAQFKSFVEGNTSPVHDFDFFPIRRAGQLYKVTGSLIKDYLQVIPGNALVDSDGHALIDSDGEYLVYG